MVVNINPCASIYDETLQALKFSAIATQVRDNSVVLYNEICDLKIHRSILA